MDLKLVVVLIPLSLMNLFHYVSKILKIAYAFSFYNGDFKKEL